MVTLEAQPYSKDISVSTTPSQNCPNPLNPSTTVRCALPPRSHVTISIYNTLGQLVSTPVNDEEEVGYHDVKFDGSNLGSGVYSYRLRAGGFV